MRPEQDFPRDIALAEGSDGNVVGIQESLPDDIPCHSCLWNAK